MKRFSNADSFVRVLNVDGVEMFKKTLSTMIFRTFHAAVKIFVAAEKDFFSAS